MSPKLLKQALSTALILGVVLFAPVQCQPSLPEAYQTGPTDKNTDSNNIVSKKTLLQGNIEHAEQLPALGRQPQTWHQI